MNRNCDDATALGNATWRSCFRSRKNSQGGGRAGFHVSNLRQDIGRCGPKAELREIDARGWVTMNAKTLAGSLTLDGKPVVARNTGAVVARNPVHDRVSRSPMDR